MRRKYSALFFPFVFGMLLLPMHILAYLTGAVFKKNTEGKTPPALV